MKRLKHTKCEISFLILSYLFIILGCILIIQNEKEKEDKYTKESFTAIYTSYENTICSFEEDCSNLLIDNGCSNYFSIQNQVNFNCSYLNIVLGSDSGIMMCNLNHYEKGFSYPEFGEVWYNSTYTHLYENVNVGDKIKVWYSASKGECLYDYDNPSNKKGLILFIVGVCLFIISLKLRNKKVVDQPKVISQPKISILIE